MTKHLIPIDISHLPDLLRLVEEVKTTHKPRLLKRKNENVAILMPVDTAEQTETSHAQEQDIWASYHPKQVQQALQHSAGTLEGVDRETLLTDIAAQRHQDSHGR